MPTGRMVVDAAMIEAEAAKTPTVDPYSTRDRGRGALVDELLGKIDDTLGEPAASPDRATVVTVAPVGTDPDMVERVGSPVMCIMDEAAHIPRFVWERLEAEWPR